MSEISIKVAIAGRLYPIKTTVEEQGNIEYAAEMINEQLKIFEENYSVKDKQDSLVMCTLHFVNQVMQLEKKVVQAPDTSAIDKKLADIKNLLIQNT